MFITSGLVYLQFIGCVFATTFNIALLGELNNDARINYADASLLEMHLIHLKKLPDEKLEYADMNGDKAITITDLSLLIHKIENILDYEVTITNLEPENAFPNKNQEITIRFNGDVSYGANIKKVVMNKIEYEVEKDMNTSFYTFKINAGENPGVKDYTITEALLDNNKNVKIDYAFKIDVLKDIPTIENYHVEENSNDSKLNLLFNVLDNNDSIESSYVEVYDMDENLVTKENVVKGENNIEILVEEKKEYKANIILNYNLSSTPNYEEHKGSQVYEKELQLLIDYNFNIANIKTFKENQETASFNKEDQVKLVFESTNATKHIPEIVKVNGKEYDITEENGKYVAILDAITELGSQTLKIEEVILANGKKFELNENNFVDINVVKRIPNILDFSTVENTESNNLRVMFDLDDKDDAISELKVILMDATGNEISTAQLSSEQLKDKENSAVNLYLKTVLTSKYKVKIIASYNITGESKDNVTKEVLTKEVPADPQAIIKSVTPNKEYIEKEGALKLTYDIESNIEEDIVDILINNTKYIAVKKEEGKYEVTLNAPKISGIYSLLTNRLYYHSGIFASVSNTIDVDVLKNKPSVINFTQIDKPNENEVTLSFDILDKDNSFISGKAILTCNDEVIEKNVVKGYNELTFKVNSQKSYNFEIQATYDLDSNTLASKPIEDNKVIDEVIDTRNIELITDYELNIGNIKTYSDKGETKYFDKSEPIHISFESTNVTNFEPEKVVISLLIVIENLVLK